MALIEAIAILVVFLVFGLLMMLELTPTFIALGAMAIGIALVGGLGLSEIVTTVIGEGSTRLATAYVATFFGGTLGVIIRQTGIAEDMIKTAAELGGDNPLVVAVFLYVAIAVSFTSLAGLGAFIMVATIAFPVMTSVGFPRKVVGGITLLAFSNGIMFNPANWVFYSSLTGIQLQSVIQWAIPTGVAAFIAGMIYIVYTLRTNEVQETWAESADERSNLDRGVPTYALLSPVIPIVLVFLGANVLLAFIVGIIFAVITSRQGINALREPRTVTNQITQAFHDGISDTAPAIALQVVIGWLLMAVSAEPIQQTMRPLLTAIVPENLVIYAIVFIILAPLALYRGPLNLYGLGAGIMSLLVAVGINPQLVTTTAVSTLRVQAPADPTNTYNVWGADELEVNVIELTKNVLPFAWATAAVGIVISVVLFGS